MKKPHSERALTLVEVVVILIACVAVLMILASILPRVRSKPFRLHCGTNLSGLGKAMLIYANDYNDKFPCAGGPSSSWAARVPDWKAQTRQEAYAVGPNSPGQASISSSLYLLVRYAEVNPRWFACMDEKGVTEFKPKKHGIRNRESFELWDFGPNPPKHVSYAYHQPYSPHPLTISSDPGMAVAADRNPWMDSPFVKARTFSKFKPDIAPFNGTEDDARQGNAIAHKGDGQNVLFLDSHVEFAKRSYCGLNNDNIYTSWDGQDAVRGKPAKFGSVPADPNDSLLVNDPAVWPKNP